MSGPFVVLGGGVYQLPLILAARRRGLDVLLFDGSADALGFQHATRGAVVDIADPVAVTEAAREAGAIGIAYIVTEVAVRSAAEACATLGLPSITPDVARRCTDKQAMRECFAAAGLPVPRFRAVSSTSEAMAGARELGFPLVVKPVDSSGSRGVRRCESMDELASAVDAALASSRSRRAILESFLDGPEYTVETYTVNGRTEILGVSDKDRLPFPHLVSINLTYGPFADDRLRTAIGAAAVRAIEATGLETGPGHTEVMATPDGPVVVEVACRGGGYRIFNDILPRISGVDPVEAVIDHALGRTPTATPTVRRAGVLRFFNPPERGRLVSVEGVDAARKMPNVLDVVIEATIGKPFHGITRDGERPGYIISIADTRADAVAAADRAERAVTFTIDTAVPVGERA